MGGRIGEVEVVSRQEGKVEMEQVIMVVQVAELRQEDGQGDDGDGAWDRDGCVFPGGDGGIWPSDGVSSDTEVENDHVVDGAEDVEVVRLIEMAEVTEKGDSSVG